MNKQPKYLKQHYDSLDSSKAFFYAMASLIGTSIAIILIFNFISICTQMSVSDFSKTQLGIFLQVIAGGITYLIVFSVYSIKNKVNIFSAVRVKTKFSPIIIAISIILPILFVFLFAPFINVLDNLFINMGYVPSEFPMLNLQGGSIIIALIGYAVVPAICEELLFRGLIQNGLLKNYNVKTALGITTAMFVIMHGSLQQTVYQIVLGLSIGLLAYYGGSIIYAIVFHFFNNATVIVLQSIGNPNYFMSLGNSFWGVVLAILLAMIGISIIFGLIYVLKIISKKNNTLSVQDFVCQSDNVISTNGQKLNLRDYFHPTNQVEGMCTFLAWAIALANYIM